MKRFKIIFSIIMFGLVVNSGYSYASYWSVCHIRAKVIEVSNHKHRQDSKSASDNLNLAVEFIAKPFNCSGHGAKYKGTEKKTLVALVNRKVNVKEIKPGVTVVLKNNYSDGLAKDGMVINESWSIISVELFE